MAIDEFRYDSKDRDDPASSAAAVTPNDSTNLSNITRGVYIGVGGNMKVTMEDGQTLLFTGLSAGAIYPLRLTRIWADTTTASSIVALW